MHGRMLTLLALLALGITPAQGCSPLRGKSLNPFSKPAAPPPSGNMPGESIESAPPPGPDSAIDKPVNSKEDKLSDDLLKSPTSFSPSELTNHMKNKLGMGPDEQAAKTAYAEADALFRHQRYEEAAGKYEEAGNRWPDSVLEEDAMFMQAESRFFNDEYSAASDIYTNLLKKYENSRYLDKIEARNFLIARYWEQEAEKIYNYSFNFSDKTRPLWDPRGNALAIYKSIRINDPTGPFADDAMMATATQYFLHGDYDNADYYYSLLRREYPNSEHQAQAHLLGIQAKLASYQGPQYAKEALVEADKLIDSTLKQFALQLPNERQRLLDAKNQVRYQLAEREWVGGEYYFNRHFYRAASYHYNLLIKDFPDTPFAEKAKQRLAESVDKPAEPVNHFLWLGKLFGETGK